MNNAATVWRLTLVQLRMYVRDRQSVILALFFPVFFMLALGFAVDDEIDPINVSVVHAAAGTDQHAVIDALRGSALLSVHEENEQQARRALAEGERVLVLLLPDASIETGNASETSTLSVLVNAADPQRTQQALAILRAALTQIEHAVRGSQPLFALEVEDVYARDLRYVEFLIPGLLALMVMQLAITGSGFNIVEYKRKGILKRLFVTPLRPSQFVASLIAMRLVAILAQISLLLIIGLLAFDIEMRGSAVLLYAFVITGGVLFLSLGFALGGIARTQNSIILFGNLFIFPQVFVAGVFFPIDSLPPWLQHIAALLPLNFLSSALRQIVNEGAGLLDLGVDIAGIAIWMAIGLFLAIRFFRWSEAANA